MASMKNVFCHRGNDIKCFCQRGVNVECFGPRGNNVVTVNGSPSWWSVYKIVKPDTGTDSRADSQAPLSSLTNHERVSTIVMVLVQTYKHVYESQMLSRSKYHLARRLKRYPKTRSWSRDEQGNKWSKQSAKFLFTLIQNGDVVLSFAYKTSLCYCLPEVLEY